MSIRKELEDALHIAMRTKDEITKNTIRMVLSSIKFVEIETQKPLDDQGILSILQKEIKIRRETLKEIETSNRPDLEAKAVTEIKILERYLPAQLSDEQIISLAKGAISDSGASSPQEMGKVMKLLLPKLAGLATPDRVSAIVKQLLSK